MFPLVIMKVTLTFKSFYTIVTYSGSKSINYKSAGVSLFITDVKRMKNGRIRSDCTSVPETLLSSDVLTQSFNLFQEIKSKSKQHWTQLSVSVDFFPFSHNTRLFKP